jgi:hypothetical protein
MKKVEYESKSLRLTTELWELIESDAGFEKRSATKQIELILEQHYGIRPTKDGKESVACVGAK